GTPGAKPPAPGAKPTTPAAAGAKPPVPAGARPPAAGAKPPAPAGAAPKPPAPPKKPAPPKNRFAHVDSNAPQLGEKMVDLGFLDDGQLEALYEDMRTVESTLAELVKERGLLSDEQLLQATAEVHGMRVANLEDVKPDAAAIKAVPKNMAELYKLVP